MVIGHSSNLTEMLMILLADNSVIPSYVPLQGLRYVFTEPTCTYISFYSVLQFIVSFVHQSYSRDTVKNDLWQDDIGARLLHQCHGSSTAEDNRDDATGSGQPRRSYLYLRRLVQRLQRAFIKHDHALYHIYILNGDSRGRLREDL